MKITNLAVVCGTLLATLGTVAVAGDWDLNLQTEETDQARVPAIRDAEEGVALASIKTRLTPQEFEALASLAKIADNLSDRLKLTAGLLRKHTLGFDVSREPNGARRVRTVVIVKSYTELAGIFLSAHGPAKTNYYFIADSDGVLSPEVLGKDVGPSAGFSAMVIPHGLDRPLSDSRMQRYLQDEVRFWVDYAKQRK